MICDATIDSPYFELSISEMENLPKSNQFIIWDVPYEICDIVFPHSSYLGEHEVIHQVLCSDGIVYFIKLLD